MKVCEFCGADDFGVSESGMVFCLECGFPVGIVIGPPTCEEVARAIEIEESTEIEEVIDDEM